LDPAGPPHPRSGFTRILAPRGVAGGTIHRPSHLTEHAIQTSSALPAGSTYLAGREFDEYLIELYVRHDRLRHAVVRPKMFHSDGRPNLRELFTRMPAFSREVMGDKMYHSYSVEG
jgi:hypothetical protein